MNTLIKIAMMAGLLQIAQFSVVEAAICSKDQSDVLGDSAQLIAKINAKYGTSNMPQLIDTAFTEVAHVDLMDGKYHKVDRLESRLPLLRVFDAVGIVSGEPIPKSGESISKMKFYGTTTMISSCGHFLVNRHVVKLDSDAVAGKKSLYISVGQKSCESKNQFFSHENIPASLLAIGDDNGDDNDWAILKAAPINDVNPMIPSEYPLTNSRTTITVGFPSNEILNDINKFKYSRAQIRKPVEAWPDGTVVMSNYSEQAGSSGSMIADMAVKNGKPFMRFSAIAKRGDGQAVQTAIIIKRLKAKAPNVWADIQRCNEQNNMDNL